MKKILFSIDEEYYTNLSKVKQDLGIPISVQLRKIIYPINPIDFFNNEG